jgi:hypothetical protein
MPKQNESISQKARGPLVLRAFLFSALSIPFALLTTSCAPQSLADGSVELAPLAKSTTETLGCSADFESAFYDGLYNVALSQRSFVEPTAFRTVIGTALYKGRLEKTSVRDQAELSEKLTQLYTVLTREALVDGAKPATTREEILEVLTSLEIGDASTPERAALQTKLRGLFDEIQILVAGAGELAACVKQVSASANLEAAEPAEGTLFRQLMTARHPVVAGGLKAMAVGYQSCEAPFKAALGPNTPDVRGVTITGPWPSPSPGNKREISNLAALLSSHPYLSDYRRPSASCFNVLARPLIYDYGGKPNTTSTGGAGLDFFTNQGGTGVLGIDCSGYVFSSLATSGLRISKGKALKPIQVHATNAAKFMRPKSSGLTCFNPISFNAGTTIRPGDILASGGHIMIIDTVGNDPFGIANITKESDCIASKMSSDRFEMTFLQSGSAKGGLGLSRMRPEGFLPEDEEPMDKAMKEYAAAACKARLRGKTVTITPSTGALVRHSGSSDCLGTKVRLVHEDCVASCPAR